MREDSELPPGIENKPTNWVKMELHSELLVVTWTKVSKSSLNISFPNLCISKQQFGSSLVIVKCDYCG